MSDDSKATVLIADNERSNIITLKRILKQHYEIMVATDGETALSMAQAQHPDIILLDVVIPDMSGYEVLERLKGAEETKDIPVIFVAEQRSVEEEAKGLKMGAVDYITKPYHESIVLARIDTQLRTMRYIRTIEQLCMLDTLTELPNRRGFDSRMEAEWGRAIRENSPIGVLMIDIDKFKLYNDTYGHQQGDVVLRTLAAVMRKSLSRATDYAARWGGEEFIVLLPNTDLRGSVVIAEQIRKNVECMTVEGTNTSVTVSVGVNSVIPGAGDSIKGFISVADKALYQSKDSGRNRVTPTPWTV